MKNHIYEKPYIVETEWMQWCINNNFVHPGRTDFIDRNRELPKLHHSQNAIITAKKKVGVRHEPKPVYCRNISDGTLRLFPSLTVASKVTKISRTQIGSSVCGKQKTAGGFKWWYESQEEPELIRKAPVKILDVIAKECLVFEDRRSAAVALGVTASSIDKLVAGTTRIIKKRFVLDGFIPNGIQ